jgi:cell wall-associated NlpC family hydrolase
MPKIKSLPLAVVFTLTLGLSAAHAQTSAPYPYTRSAPTDHRGDSLTERGAATSDSVSNSIGNGAYALGSGVQRVTDRAADLIMHAMSVIGVPYRFGGTSTMTGFDCSGFVQTMYRQTVGKLLPRSAAEQASATQAINKDDLQPGDLVFFDTVRRRAYSHVGIYVGDGQFIHAPSRHEQVRLDYLSASYWRKHFEGARRVFTDAPDNTPYSSDNVRLAVASAADGLIGPQTNRHIIRVSDNGGSAPLRNPTYNADRMIMADNAPAGAAPASPASPTPSASELSAPMPAPVTVAPPAPPPTADSSAPPAHGKRAAAHTGKHGKAKPEKHSKAKSTAKSGKASKRDKAHAHKKANKSSAHPQPQHTKHTKKK